VRWPEDLKPRVKTATRIITDPFLRPIKLLPFLSHAFFVSIAYTLLPDVLSAIFDF
jgi:hypothetical protein